MLVDVSDILVEDLTALVGRPGIDKTTIGTMPFLRYDEARHLRKEPGKEVAPHNPT